MTKGKQKKLISYYVLIGLLIFICLFSIGLIDSIEMAQYYKQISDTAITKYYSKRVGGSNIDVMFIADAIAMIVIERLYRKYSPTSP